MSGGKFHVHGPHDHAVEHEAAHGEDHGKAKVGASLAQMVAIFTAILATIGAIVSYQGGHTQNEALLHNKLAQAMTLIQIAISLASICVLTRCRWTLGLAGVAAAGGLVYWALPAFATSCDRSA